MNYCALAMIHIRKYLTGPSNLSPSLVYVNSFHGKATFKVSAAWRVVYDNQAKVLENFQYIMKVFNMNFDKSC